jgi:hypothetical protein
MSDDGARFKALAVEKDWSFSDDRLEIMACRRWCSNLRAMVRGIVFRGMERLGIMYDGRVCVMAASRPVIIFSSAF